MDRREVMINLKLVFGAHAILLSCVHCSGYKLSLALLSCQLEQMLKFFMCYSKGKGILIEHLLL